MIKNKLHLILPVFFFSGLWAQDAALRKELDAPVVSATVYADRALVGREASLVLEPGNYTLVFTKLPMAIDDSSLQLAGSGSAVLLDLKTRVASLGPVSAEVLKPFNDKKRDLQEKLTENLWQYRNLDKERSFLESLRERLLGTKVESTNWSFTDTKKWSDMLDYYRTQLGRLESNLQMREREKLDLQSEIAKIELRIRELTQSGAKETKIAEAVLQVKNKENLKLKLSYVIVGPSWQPLYDLRVSRDKRELTVVYRSVIRQQTGEMWSNVSLKLSTARPSLGGDVPQLSPWVLQEYVPSSRMYYNRAAKSSAPMASAMAEEKEMDKKSDVGAAQVPAREELIAVPESTTESAATSVNFVLEQKVTVESDNLPHQAQITEKVFPVDLLYSAVPKLSTFAYLQARVTNSSDFPLLAGSANIFVDGTYLARSSLPTVAAGEDFKVSLGVDESLSVTYTLAKKLKEADALLSGNQRYSYRYVIGVKNNRKTTEKIQIFDQFPISPRNEIKVTASEPVIKPSTNAAMPKLNENNFIEWNLELKPSEKIELSIAYLIEFPKNMTLSGIR